MFSLHRRVGQSRIGLTAIMLLVVSMAGGGSPSSPAALASPEVGPKPGSISQLPETSGGTTTSSLPAPGSKNATTQPLHDPNGVTTSAPATPGSKNDGGELATAMGAAAAPSGWRFNACGSIQDGGWTTTSASFETIRSCTLTLPEAGFVYMRGSSSLGIKEANYEARFNLNIDSTAGNTNTDRWINAYTDATDGTDKNIELTWLAPVSAGAHTFYFLGARYNGSGTVQLYDPSFSVLYFPSSSADVLACGDSGQLVWNTSETSFQQVRACALNVPQSGFVYMNGSSSAGLASGGQPYEARYRLGVDSVSGTASTDRWVNVTTDSGDGTDEAVATSLLTSVAAGAHTFYFSATRYNGTGPVQLYDPALSVIYFPAPNVTAKVCGAGGSDTWTNSTTSYSVIRSCTLNVPDNSFAFIDATASAGLNDTGAGNDWEGQFRVGVDNDTGSSIFDRWINVYTDATDGTDRPVSNGGLVNISKGVHTFYFVGRRYAGNGTLRLYSPSLTVIVPGATNYIPIVGR
ncbi:MAG: hypothetical protein JOZ51_17960 [Chloroflexi bacterium]|nr:hypothetical protein [Chloroflexota bacterium]